jgi:PAS domain S-box-containing protein
MLTSVLACSAVLQLTAAVMAFRLIRLTGRRTAWSLIAIALILMSIRRVIPLYRLLSGDPTIAPDLLSELIGLALSALMVLGVAGIAPLFSAIKRSHKALRKSEELYRAVFENTGTATVLIEENTIISHANAEFEKLSKCSKQEIEGKKSWTDFVVKEDLDRMRAQHLLRREKLETALKQYEFRFITNDGDIRNIFLSIDVIPGTKRSVASLLDITERKRAEMELARVNRALRMFSDSNQALIRMTDEAALLNEVCRIAVEVGGYHLVWVGFAEQDEAKTVRPVAHAGFDSGYIESANISWADGERGHGPGGIAIRTGQPAIVRNIPEDPTFAPWREAAIRHGYKSIIALPLISEGQTLGVLGIYAREADAFDAKEVEILKELVGDLAFGITALHMRAKRDLAEEALRESEELYHSTVVSMSEGIVLYGAGGEIIAINAGAERILGFTGDELMNRTNLDQLWRGRTVHEDGSPFPGETHPALNTLQTGMPAHDVIMGVHRPDGTLSWISINSEPLSKPGADKPYGVVTSLADITERKRAESIMQARLRLLEFANSHSMDELLIATLDEIEALTGSTIGFYHLLESDQETLSLHNWSTNTLKNMCTAEGKGSHYGVAQAGVWADCVGERGPVVHNDYVSLPHRKGMPEGHALVVREVVVPIFRGSMIMAIIGVGNKLTDYDEKDIEIVSQLGDLSWDIADRKQAGEALRESEQRMRYIIDFLPDATFAIDRQGKVIAWNRAIEQMTGVSASDMLGKGDYEYAIPFYGTRRPILIDLVFDNSEEIRAKYSFVDIENDILTAETVNATPKGRDVALWGCAAPLYDSLGNAVGAIESIRDITERKRAEVVLAASEVRYRRLFESAKDGILILDAETGMIVDVNPFLVEILGYSHEQFLGKSIWEVGFLSDAVASKYNFRKLQQEKYVRYDDLPLETSDGGQIEVEFVSNVYDVGGKKVIQCNIRDVTGRKRAKKALIASEIRYRRLFESAKDGILILDAETGMVVDVNPFLIEMLGYSHEQFLGKAVWELASLNELVLSKDNFRKLQREKYVRYDDLPLETTDGRRIAVEFISNVYEVGDTKVIQCNIRNVTDRKHAEAALRESEQKLKATVYGSPIPQFVIDRDHRVVYWNKALEEISGRKAEEMVGTNNHWLAFYKEKRPCMCDLLVDGHTDSIPKWYGDQCRKSRIVAGAFEVTDYFPHLGDGGKWLFFTAAAIKDSNGNVIGAMETLEDVTGRIKVEMEIHQLNEDLERRVADRTAQLQAANRELEAFSYSVSHDLRAPLRALDGFSRILIEDYAAQLPAEAVGHLNRVRNGAVQMGRLIDDLLRFSRLGRQPLEKQPVNLSALVEEIWSALESERKGRQVDWVIGSLPECQGDPSLLRQVFFNLLGNALKYSRLTADARIEIGFLPQVVRAGEAPATNVYFVRDNGVGFDMQFAGKLFGVFQRLHRPDEYEGTGVGLAIVHRIVARHGGRIWAESEPDKGATFYLTIGDAPVPTVPTAEKAMV